MHILILGGTQFIGRQIALALLDAGHRVTVFNRGRTADDLPAGVERLRGDRDLGIAGLGALAGGNWDACVDVSGYTARQVRPSAELLRGRVGRYVYVSAVSVYGDPQDRPVRETHPLVPPIDEDVTELDQETYGRLKVTCERIVHDSFGDRCAMLRPQIVVGPGDPDDRLWYWIRRAELGGEMLAPGDGGDHVQTIDVRDVARFVRNVIENDLGGTFNLAGPRWTWADFLARLGATDLVWTPAEILRAAGVDESELPLYRHEHGPRAGLMDVSNERAQSAGLTLTDFGDTLHDARAWLAGREWPLALSREREAELIAAARMSKSSR